MRLAFLLLFASLAQATSVTVPITVTVTDQNCTAWTVAGTSITCTSSGPTPPPPSGWPPSCATKSFTAPWPEWPHRYLPDDYGGFDPDDILVMRFTTGTTLTPAGKYDKISAAEWNSSPSWRVYQLSATPCTFPPNDDVYPTSMTIYFQVGTVENLNASPKILLPGKTYYLNVKNKAGAQCFATGGCNMFFDVTKVAGT